jgi:hypothetical protein
MSMTTTAAPAPARIELAPDELVIVTADKIADTGTITYLFMMELPNEPW